MAGGAAAWQGWGGVEDQGQAPGDVVRPVAHFGVDQQRARDPHPPPAKVSPATPTRVTPDLLVNCPKAQ